MHNMIDKGIKPFACHWPKCKVLEKSRLNTTCVIKVVEE
jgi:hypothetical protein